MQEIDKNHTRILNNDAKQCIVSNKPAELTSSCRRDNGDRHCYAKPVSENRVCGARSWDVIDIGYDGEVVEVQLVIASRSV